MVQEYDIAKALSYQIKREIAERFFTARKVIDDDLTLLHQKIKEINDFYDLILATDFLRLYTLLVKREFINKFLGLLNIKNEIFYDEYMINSKTIRARLLSGLTEKGWTSFGRFYNKFKFSYMKLQEDLANYKKLVDDTLEFEEVIRQEVAQLKSKFSLDEMLCFMRELDRDDTPSIMGDNICCKVDRLEDCLGYQVPDVKVLIHTFSPIPKWDDISSEIEVILKQAFEIQEHNH